MIGESPLPRRVRLDRRQLVGCLVVALIAAGASRALLFAGPRPQSPAAGAAIDVLHYGAEVEPLIASKSVRGKVLIRFVAQRDGLDVVTFDRGDLAIESITHQDKPQTFTTSKQQVTISLSQPMKAGEQRDLQIVYSGKPRYGVRFFPDQNQVYTVFSTSQWLVCVDAPSDRATFTLDLILPKDMTATGNGVMVFRRSKGDKVIYRWDQKTAVPTYTFGFAAGPFREATDTRGAVRFRYLATSFSDAEMRRIFHDTGDMLTFYEERAGMRYADSTYTQVLAAGNAEQEMSSFTALNEGYARKVLANERELWLAAHEFAHQWWGNMVTCRDWNHFWLNEGIANFMTAAYIEHRFGHAEYLREIDEYRKSYEKVRAAGKDKSLVFPDWLHPTAEDRTLVYDKGGYVMHLLREEMGDELFWKGLRAYTQTYFGKSVVTSDFQLAMERASGKNLQQFFARWVYLETTAN